MTDRRRELKRQYQAAERDRERALIGLTPGELTALLDFLDERLGERGCDHSYALTRTWLADHGHGEAVLRGLGDLGGYCDCEVLANLDGQV